MTSNKEVEEDLKGLWKHCRVYKQTNRHLQWKKPIERMANWKPLIAKRHGTQEVNGSTISMK